MGRCEMISNLTDAMIVINEQKEIIDSLRKQIKEKDALIEKAFYAGRTVQNYKGEWVDDLFIDTYTSAKYKTAEEWINQL